MGQSSHFHRVLMIHGVKVSKCSYERMLARVRGHHFVHSQKKRIHTNLLLAKQLAIIRIVSSYCALSSERIIIIFAETVVS